MLQIKKPFQTLFRLRFIRFLLTLCGLTWSFMTQAGTEPVSSARITPGNVTVNRTLTNREPFFPAGLAPTGSYPGYYVNTEARDELVLAIDNSLSTYIGSEFTCSVTIRVRRMTDAFVTDSFDKTLNVTYDPARGVKHKDKEVYQFYGGHYLSIKILSVSDPTAAQYLYVETNIELTHYRRLDVTTQPSVTTVAETDPNELQVIWSAVDGAESYDLEWTFEDDYTGNPSSPYLSASTIPYSFEDHCGRVRVTGNSYRLSNTFKQGYVLFRVRGVGYDTIHIGPTILGKWSDASITTKLVSNMPSGAKYHSTGTFEPKLTWQYAAAYSEEGKVKEVISYFDGSMRNRQMVTRTNTDTLALVGETIYDHQGRPAVQVLPVPDLKRVLNYYDSFNLNLSDMPYSRADFDIDGGSCDNAIAQMSTDSGASRYYSTNNNIAGQFDDLFHNYIPTAGGYPFTLTEYTPDNTGRIRRQSGVGSSHMLGTGHEIKYYYAKPSQEELNMLFGTDVGYADHYKKNMVEDANGQVSISYLDASGKVIATALAGEGPSGLQDLPSNTGGDLMTENLLNPGDTAVTENAFVASRTFVVSNANTDYYVDYKFNDVELTSDCLPENVCYDCVYDLTISLTDQCGNEMLHGDTTTGNPTPLVRTLGKVGSNFSLTCGGNNHYSISTDSLLDLLPDTELVVSLGVGSYTLTKTLAVSQEALDYYTDRYIQESTCVLSEQDFIDSFVDRIDFSGCGQSCAECTAALGTRADYIHQELVSLANAGVDWDISDSVAAGVDYDSLVTECNKPCQPTNFCEANLYTLMADIMPGGQYGQYDVDTLETDYVKYSASDNNSVFNIGASGITDFTSTSTGLQLDSITINGVRKAVTQLSELQILTYWQPEWAEKLVKLHPEYCYYQWCSLNNESNEYDAAMIETDSYDSAVAHGYLDPMTNDPYFKTTGKGRYQKPDMQDIMDEYSAASEYRSDAGLSEIYSMKQVALMGFVCKEHTSLGDQSALVTCLGTYNFDSIGCETFRDFAWITFRSMYLAEKQNFQEKYRRDSFGCNNNSVTLTKRFPTNNQFKNAYIGTNIHLNPDSASDNLSVIVNDSMPSKCLQQCQAYAQYWMLQLAGCNLNSTDSETVVNALIDVCQGGCDSLHAFGSSTSPSGSTLTYKTFQAVIQNLATYVPGICDANLISMPMPYDHDYFAKDNPYADTCACQKTQVYGPCNSYVTLIFDPATGLPHYAMNAGDPQSSENPSCACTSSRTREERAAFISRSVPDSLKCNHCIDCDTMHAAVERFYAWYDGTDVVDENLNFKDLFRNYLNNDLGFNLIYEDYINFMSECSGYDGPDSTILDTFRGTFNVESMGNMLLAGGTESLDEGDTSGSMSLLLDPGDPDRGRMDTCACKTLMKMAYDSAHHAAGSVASQWASQYPGISFPDINSRLKNCQWFFHQQGQGDWDSTKKIERNTYVFMNTAVDADEDLTVPNVIKCPLPSPGDSCAGCGAQHDFTPSGIMQPSPCDLIEEIMDKYYENHHPEKGSMNDDEYAEALKEYNDGLADTLNREVDGRTDTLFDVDHYYDIMMQCHGTSSCHYKPLCGLRPLPILYNLQAYLDSLAEDSVVCEDRFLALYPDYPSYYDTSRHLYRGVCASDLYKSTIAHENSTLRVENIDLQMKDDPCGNHYNDIGLTFKYASYKYHGRELMFQYLNIRAFSNIRVMREWPNTDTTHLFEVDALVRRPHQADTIVPMTGYATFVTGTTNNCPALCNEPIVQIQHVSDSSCQYHLINIATHNAEMAYAEYIDSVKRYFQKAYLKKCMSITPQEKFQVRHEQNEYHFTLYYYDQVGNLSMTVPPGGAHPFPYRKTLMDSINNERKTQAMAIAPSHTYKTLYRYNTMNQVTVKYTPDADTSRFWYDRLAKLVVSRNAQQKDDGKFSYTKYDALGRIMEVGEIAQTTGMSQSISRSDASFATWLSGGTKTQITRTWYDNVKYTIVHGDFAQENLRSRVASITYQDVDGSSYDYGTHYNYDVHGNVKQLIQQFAELSGIGHNFKQTDYYYDRVSGNVKYVYYQKGMEDQFTHKYEYDADNRITNVYTSPDGVNWDEDATYFYYKHGPLGRMEVGQDKVQGIDYAYTIQGWLKGVNSNTLNATRDIGRDGGSSYHHTVAQDAFGFSLGYFINDYTATGGSTSFIADESGKLFGTASSSLYNGNIHNWVMSILGDSIMGTSFSYDQLNRIHQVLKFNNIDTSNNQWDITGTPLNEYSEAFTYDPNGNILALDRNSVTSGGSNVMDDLTYHYYPGNNRLKWVNDDANSAHYSYDIDDNTDTSNYIYDKIGNMTQDKSKGLHIAWTAYGKVKYVARSGKDTIFYEYDAMGQRVKKAMGDSAWYYSRDAQGNVMATYLLNNDNDTFYVMEYNIYGSSRVGMYRPDSALVQPEDEADTVKVFSHNKGSRNYELSNHLGNVVAVVSDRKLQVNNSGTVAYYTADLLSWNDYYVFGSPIVERSDVYEHIVTDTMVNTVNIANQTFSSGATHGWSAVPIPGNSVANVGNALQVNAGSPGINAVNSVSVTNGETYYYSIDINLGTSTSVNYAIGSGGGLAMSSGTYTGTVTASSSSLSLGVGMGGGMPGGNFFIDNVIIYRIDSTITSDTTKSKYRYGFNGKEKDNEWKGEGIQYDYGFRVYDSRLGRFLSVDPLTKDYPWYTPYQFAGNTPIEAIDLDGKEPTSVITPENHFTKPALRLLSLVSGATEKRLAEAKVIERNIFSGYIPWYSAGGAITINNSIYYTNDFFNGGVSDNVADWLHLSSHEVGHFFQYDVIKIINESLGGGQIYPHNQGVYLLTFGADYCQAAYKYGISQAHDKAIMEQKADEGMKNFEGFVEYLGGGGTGSYAKGLGILNDMFQKTGNFTGVSEQDQLDAITRAYAGYLVDRIEKLKDFLGYCERNETVGKLFKDSAEAQISQLYQELDDVNNKTQ